LIQETRNIDPRVISLRFDYCAPATLRWSFATVSALSGRALPGCLLPLMAGKWTYSRKLAGSEMCHEWSHAPQQNSRHSITSSARARSVGGTERPRILAVLRLITSSSFVGCSTGKSPGVAPLKILSIRPAARKYRSG